MEVLAPLDEVRQNLGSQALGEVEEEDGTFALVD